MADLYYKELEYQKDALKTAGIKDIEIPNYIISNLKH